MINYETVDVFASTFIFMVGFSAFNAGLWPSLEGSIPSEHIMGRAFGMVSTMQNGVILLSLLVGGYLLPPNYEWSTFMWYCFSLAMACLVASLVIGAIDATKPESDKIITPVMSRTTSPVGAPGTPILTLTG